MKKPPRCFVPLCLLVPALLLLSACATRQSAGPLEPAAARDIWKSYVQYAEKSAEERRQPARVQASLRFGGNDDGRRVIVLLWENGNGAIRLDVRAGVGVSAAKILQTDSRFLVYAVQENLAYYHEGSQQSLLAYGLPLPFGLRDLAALLAGDYGAVFGLTPPKDPRSAQGGGMSLTLPQKENLGGVLQLDPQGLPRSWKEEKGGWRLTFSYDDNRDFPRPEQIEARHEDGNYAILLIKERQRPEQPYTPEQLDLKLPPGTPMLPMRQLKRL
jgi:outer membrane biogenesis lipoprotein LolB